MLTLSPAHRGATISLPARNANDFEFATGYIGDLNNRGTLGVGLLERNQFVRLPQQTERQDISCNPQPEKNEENKDGGGIDIEEYKEERKIEHNEEEKLMDEICKEHEDEI